LQYFMMGFISTLALYINVKILIRDRKYPLFEWVYVCCTIFLIGSLYRLLILTWRYHFTIAFSVVILYLLPQLLLISYLKIKGYPLKKGLILSSLSIFIWVLVDLVVLLIWEAVWGNRLISDFENVAPLQIIAYIIVVALASISITLIFTQITIRFRRTINETESLQNVLAVIAQSALYIGSFILMFAPIIYQLVNIGVLIIMLIGLSLALITGAGLTVTFSLYAKNLESKHRLHRKEEEQANLLYYTTTIERQYTEIRKFRHDYENILTSLQSFIVDQDYVALEAYYFEKLKPASERLMLKKFQLEPLARVEIKELKSIFAVKLMSAQAEEIDVSFEVPKPIIDVAIDTVALVRIVGILLDNAIEELKSLGTGMLSVGMIKGEEYVDLIVKNTCRMDLTFDQLKQAGFSTKGQGRGMGLSNLLELVHENPLLSLETRIEKGEFIQRITIEN